ncbi:MAG TPA: MarR family transcriptional regulator [Chloroflexota bacterium]|nr:MarR family transcriptional regulator [Chloroflexota bacterium]
MLHVESTPVPAAENRDPEAVLRVDRSIRQAFLLLDALYRRTQAGLTPALSTSQYYTLAAIAEEPSQSLGDLAARRLCDKANVSVLLDRLTKDGLATRRRDEQDKRRVEVNLTPAGWDALERASAARSDALTQALAPLDTTGMHTTADALERVVELLQAAVAATEQDGDPG